MSGKIEGFACTGIYDDSANMCRSDEVAVASPANNAPETSNGLNSELERRAQYYAGLFKDRGDLTFHKSYWIDENGAVTHALFDVNNPDPKMGTADQEYRRWQKAQGCGETKNEILNGNKILGGAYGPQDCFGSAIYPISHFRKVFDYYTGSTVEPWDRERRHGENMLAVDMAGQTFHAVGFRDGNIAVLYMFGKKYDRNLVGQPPPSGKLLDMRVMDYGNDHTTDLLSSRLVSHAGLDISERTASTTGALTLFDPIWENENPPDSYSYVADFKPGELEVYVKEGDKVNIGDRLFSVKGNEPFCAEARSTVNYIQYVKLGEQLDMRIDADKGWMKSLLAYF